MAGRPAKYDNDEEMLQKIEEYFASCQTGEECSWINKRGEPEKGTLPIPPSLEDLTLYLGFNSVSSLDDYKQRSEAFSAVLSRARLLLVKRLHIMAMRSHIDPRYSQRVVARVDPEYRDKMDISANITGDISGKLATAFAKAGSAEKPI